MVVAVMVVMAAAAAVEGMVVAAAVAKVLVEKEAEGKLSSDKEDQQSTEVFSQRYPTGQSTSTLQRILHGQHSWFEERRQEAWRRRAQGHKLLGDIFLPSHDISYLPHTRTLAILVNAYRLFFKKIFLLFLKFYYNYIIFFFPFFLPKPFRILLFSFLKIYSPLFSLIVVTCVYL